MASTICEAAFLALHYADIGSRRFSRAFMTSVSLSTLSAQIRRAFWLLDLDPNSTDKEIKEAYIRAVKKYHPDSGSTHASTDTFTEVRDAYKKCISHAKNIALSQEIQAALEDELTEIEGDLGYTRSKRLAHRRYLTHDIGRGTVFERRKYANQQRLSRAMDDVFQKKFEKALENPVDKEVGSYTGGDPWLKESSRNWITHSIERIADDQIREAMARGDFADIAGSGKPIEHDHSNVVLDHTVHRLNKMLIDSGFAPGWVSLDKEIRHAIRNLTVRSTLVWHKCGPHPMNRAEAVEWEKFLAGIQEPLNEVNAKVNRLNLIVPAVTMQRAHFRLDVIANEIASEVVPNRSLMTDQKLSEREPSGYQDTSYVSPFASSLARLAEVIKDWYHHISSKFFS